MRPKDDAVFISLNDGYDPFDEKGFNREQIELIREDDELPSREMWLRNKEQDKLKMERERRLLRDQRKWDLRIVLAWNPYNLHHSCSCMSYVCTQMMLNFVYNITSITLYNIQYKHWMPWHSAQESIIYAR